MAAFLWINKNRLLVNHTFDNVRHFLCLWICKWLFIETFSETFLYLSVLCVPGTMFVKCSKSFVHRSCTAQPGKTARANVDIGGGTSFKLVGKFCYLGDMRSVDGDADVAVEAIVQKGWNKFRQLVPIVPIYVCGQCTRSPCAVECDTLSGWGSRLSPVTSAYQRIISSNNSYTHDEQGVNPEQVRGFDSVLYKLWLLLMPWLAASMCQLCWHESQSRQIWLSPLARRWRSVSQVARCWRSAGQRWHWIVPVRA